uniref:Uncharacterized protein n=1 Tax=Rhizophora mucronata TaxID=61149 RepID=A0A2P2R0L1_RHIMU
MKTNTETLYFTVPVMLTIRKASFRKRRNQLKLKTLKVNQLAE